MLERADEHFVDGGIFFSSKSLVGAVVLVEECGDGVKSIAKLGGFCASGVGWDYGYRSGVDGHNKRSGRKRVVNGG